MESKEFLPFPLTVSVSVDGVVYTHTVTNLSVNAVAFDVKTKEFSFIGAPALEIVSLYFGSYEVGETSPVINWVKLEAGSKASYFVKPNPATEMYKCQRYLAPVSTLSELVVRDNTHTVLARSFHLRSIPTYTIYNPDNHSFYLKSLDGLTVSDPVLPMYFYRYNDSEGDMKFYIYPNFTSSLTGVLNMNKTSDINDNVTVNNFGPVLISAEP
jgi:hypothetical protein